MDESENVHQLDAVEIMKSEQQISLLAKAEIDSQIATAKAFPRSLKQSLDRIMSMATLTVEIAESCEFGLPRGTKKDGTENIIKGPSIRLAEIVFSQYGNLRGGARVILNDGKRIVAQGICHDLETNSYYAAEVELSILQHEWKDDPINRGKRVRTGRMIPMNDDMQIMTGKRGCSIAFRNSVFKVVPAAIVQPVYLKTKEIALGDAETLVARRDKAIAYLHGLGIADPQICTTMNIKAVEDIDLEKLATIRAMCNAIKEGTSTVEELFPKEKPRPEERAGNATNATVEALKKAETKANAATGRKGKAAETSPADPAQQAGANQKVEPK